MQIQYVILKVSLLSNKIPGKKIDISLEVYKTEISQMDLLSTMCQCVLSQIRKDIVYFSQLPSSLNTLQDSRALWTVKFRYYDMNPPPCVINGVLEEMIADFGVWWAWKFACFVR